MPLSVCSASFAISSTLCVDLALLSWSLVLAIWTICPLMLANLAVDNLVDEFVDNF
jgi:hypothetical protein